jgi:hypothetical protein
MYDNRLRQLPDYDMWIRLSRRFSFFVSERALAFYRWGTGDNASAETSENQVRTINEHALLAEHFFSGVPPETLREGFGDLLTLADIPSPTHFGIEKVLLYFRMTSPFSPLYRSIGLRKLADLLGSEPHREVLARDYGLGDLEFQKLAGMVQFFARASGADMPGIDAVLPPLPAGRRD